MQNLGIQTEACTFLLRIECRLLFVDKSIHYNALVKFKGTVLSSATLAITNYFVRVLTIFSQVG